MSAKVGNGEVRREALARALAGGQTVRGAAAEAGVSERTAHAYRAEAGFPDRVRRHREELFGQATSVLAGQSATAAARLAQLALSRDEKVAATAAGRLLSESRQWREQADLAEAVAQLRAEVEELRRGGNGAPANGRPVEGAGGEPPGGTADGEAGPVAG